MRQKNGSFSFLILNESIHFSPQCASQFGTTLLVEELQPQFTTLPLLCRFIEGHVEAGKIQTLVKYLLVMTRIQCASLKRPT